MSEIPFMKARPFLNQETKKSLKLNLEKGNMAYPVSSFIIKT